MTDISPACDCYGHADRPIVRDIGILASTDPVAIDQASADLVNREPGNRDSALTKNFAAGEDKFRGVYPQIDWEIQLAYGEEIGLGRRYELIPVPASRIITRSAGRGWGLTQPLTSKCLYFNLDFDVPC